MATSLPPVKISRNEWVDLYAATGISVGTRIVIQNIGKSEVILTEASIEPTANFGQNKLPSREFFTNVAGNVGAWAYSGRGSKLQVEVL